MKRSELIDIIARECSEYVELAAGDEFALMRGMEKCPHSVQLNLQPNLYTSRHDYDRNFFDVMVDKHLAKFGLLPRRDATFAITNPKVAEGFGRVFYVFPKNGFRFAYTESVVDLYPTFENWVGYDAQEDPVASKVTRSLLLDAMGDLSIIEIYCDRRPTFRKFIRERFVEELPCRGDDLAAAMRNGWEVWFDGPFHALPVDDPESMHIIEALGLQSQRYAA